MDEAVARLIAAGPLEQKLKASWRHLLEAILLYGAVFANSLYPPFDPDLGWHLKYGEHVFKTHHLLRENTFSAQLPDYQWTNSSWATDLLDYAVFDRFDFFGLSILGALVFTLTLLVLVRASRLSFLEKALALPLLLFYEGPFIAPSFRGQSLTLLSIATLLLLLALHQEGHRNALWFAVPLFLLWSNFHGEFILGLAVFFGWICLHSLRLVLSPRESREPGPVLSDVVRPVLILLLAGAAALVNPFGARVYGEAFRHFMDPLLPYMADWAPIEPNSTMWWQFVAWQLLLLLGLLQLRKERRILATVPPIGLTMALVLLSYGSRRYLWPLFIVSAPVAISAIRLAVPKRERTAGATAICLLSATLLYAFVITLPTLTPWNMDWYRYNRLFVRCSPMATEYIIRHDLTQKLLTYYDWGGWLIWRYPMLKPSIDGRMHLWTTSNGYRPFLEYHLIDWNIVDIDRSRYDVAFLPPRADVTTRLFELVREGRWDLVYHDRFSLVFVRRDRAPQETAAPSG